MGKLFDKESEIDAIGLTFSKLRRIYGTGRSYVISGSGRDRKLGYRSGVLTEIGDIEASLWERLVYDLIVRFGEQELYENLLSWCAGFPFLHSGAARKTYALELHAARIFDDAEWADYTAFNKRYRPDRLN
jgi:hypothetical protein